MLQVRVEGAEPAARAACVSVFGDEFEGMSGWLGRHLVDEVLDVMAENRMAPIPAAREMKRQLGSDSLTCHCLIRGAVLAQGGAK